MNADSESGFMSFCVLTHPISDIGIIIIVVLFLPMKKLRTRYAKEIAQGHTLKARAGIGKQEFQFQV